MLDRLAPMPTPVLFTGPSGTGKEVAARTLHAMSDRADKPFVAVNCAAVASDRCAQEFFGMTDGREGGNQDGLFLLADGGVLFLDEVAQMPEQMQAALLRVLEDQRIRPVGAERDIPLNLRFFFATNADMYDDGNGFRVEQVKARLIAEQPLHDMLIKLRAVTQIVVETIRETRSR